MSVLEITRDYTRRKAAAAIPAATYDADRRGYYLDLSDADEKSLRVLGKLFPEHAQYAPPPKVSNIRPEDLASPWAGERSAQSLLPVLPEALAKKLYRFQAVDCGFLAARIAQDGAGYLGWDRGLGKTLGAFVIMLQLGAKHSIVVTPNSSKRTVWQPEAAKWMGAEYPVYVVGKTAEARARAVKSWQMADHAILLVHYEALRLIVPKGKKLIADLVICDEAHRLANGGNAQQTGVPQFYRALQRLKSDYRLALSGSVIVNDPQDMFGALHWLYPRRYRARWADWNDRWMDYVEAEGRVCLGIKPGRDKELRRELATLMCVRLKKDELPDLPAKIDQTIMVDITPAQRKVYNSLMDSFMAELPDGKLMLTPSVLSRLAKLRQVACGLDLFGEQFTDSAKLDLAEEMVKDNAPNKTVVFAWHRATVNTLAARLKGAGVSCVVVHGDIPDRQRDEAVRLFQNDPTVTCIIATIKTLGESVTLHAAADLIFVEASWTPADMDQAADRIYRIGQKRRVTITHIVARDTVDEYKVLPALKSKADMRKLMIGA